MTPLPGPARTPSAPRGVCYIRGVSEPARRLEEHHGPDNSAEAARARGDALLHELARLNVDPATLAAELGAEDTAAALAWLRGEGPCPSTG